MATVTTSLKNIEPIKIGGGGHITGWDMHTDGTWVCRADTYGAFLWDATNSRWNQLITSTSMPAADVHVGTPAGVFAIKIAPSNSNIIYMVWEGWVYKSTNKGVTFTKTNFTRDTTMEANGGKTFSNRIAIDPLDPDVVYLGTQTIGLWYTRNGGISWTQVVTGTVPFGGTAGILDVLINPYAAAVSGRSGTIWASSDGNGDYRSTDGGETWAKPASGPANGAQHSAFAIDGQRYAIDYGGYLHWRFDTSWHQLTYYDYSWNIACDPFDAAHIVSIEASGRMAQSQDRGVTVNGTGAMQTWTQNAGGTGDIPWLYDFTQIDSDNTYMSIGQFGFHPTTQNKFITSAGLGVFSLPTLPPDAIQTYVPAWITTTKGIEQLVANQVLCPPNGNLHLAAWDKPIWKIENPNVFPTEFYTPPTSATTGINHCWAMDWASSDPDFLVAVISEQGFDVNMSAYSDDGGATWTRFAADPSTEGATEKGAGCVAASTPLNWVIQPSQNSANIGPSYTTDGGATWASCTFGGSPSFANAHTRYFLNRYIVCADRVAANTFYYYNGREAHVYRSTDSGANFTKRTSVALASTAVTIFNDKLRSVPGKEGHLWLAQGPAGALTDPTTPSGVFKRSTDGGATWSDLTDVQEVWEFCFGVTAQGASYPTIYLAGYVNNSWGIFYSTDECVTFTKIGDWPLGSLDWLRTMDASKVTFGKLYIGFGGSGFAYFDGAAEGSRRWRITTS